MACHDCLVMLEQAPDSFLSRLRTDVARFFGDALMHLDVGCPARGRGSALGIPMSGMG